MGATMSSDGKNATRAFLAFRCGCTRRSGSVHRERGLRRHRDGTPGGDTDNYPRDGGCCAQANHRCNERSWHQESRKRAPAKAAHKKAKLTAKMAAQKKKAAL